VPHSVIKEKDEQRQGKLGKKGPLEPEEKGGRPRMGVETLGEGEALPVGLQQAISQQKQRREARFQIAGPKESQNSGILSLVSWLRGKIRPGERKRGTALIPEQQEDSKGIRQKRGGKGAVISPEIWEGKIIFETESS